jgi:ribonuclease R
MRPVSSFPSRTEVIDLLSQSRGGMPAHHVREAFAIAPGKHEGFLRYLDALVFEGLLVGKPGEIFAVPTKAASDSTMPASIRQGQPEKVLKPAKSKHAPPWQSVEVAHKAASKPGLAKLGLEKGAKPEFAGKKAGKKGLPASTFTPKSAPNIPTAKHSGPNLALDSEIDLSRINQAPRSASPSGRKGVPSQAAAEMPGYSEAKHRSGARPDERQAYGARPAESAKQADAGRQTGSGSLLQGTLSLHQRGFGFVALTKVGVDKHAAYKHASREHVPAKADVREDIFIPEDKIHGAMHGDKVTVRVTGRSPKGLEGSIEAIVARGLARVSGILRRDKKRAWIEPDDTRIHGIIELAGMDMNASEGNNGEDGDLAVVQITRYPEYPGEVPVGKLIAVLGKPGELQAEVRKLIMLAGVEETHGDEAIALAESYGETVPTAMLEGRVDLTHVPLPTIDPEDARDHDDAVWVERTAAKGKKGYKAWIAIADVSSYVTPNTKLDEEAKLRACSVYLPDRAIPMLPRALSSNLCSLLPDQIRLCLCAIVEIDDEGNIVSSELVRGFMKSAAKLTYGGVAKALGFTDEGPDQPQAIAMKKDLEVAAELSKLLRRKRMDRGALDFDLPEAKVVWSEDKKTPETIQKRSQDGGVKKAYQLIEELMLLGNETVATWLVEKKIPGIFRIHPPPDPKKLERLGEMCEILGVPFDAEDAQDAKKLSELVKQFSAHESGSVLHMLLLRSMKQASYDRENLGHFGLASKAYLHFTSPIRRYPDLVVHRQVHRQLLGERIDRSDEGNALIEEAAALASSGERRAMELERDVLDCYKCVIMRDHIGEEFQGTVTSIVGSGLFVALDDPFVDVLVKHENLGRENFEVDDTGLRVVASRSGDSISIGDTMMVKVMEANLHRRQVLAIRLITTADGSSRAAGTRSDEDGPRGRRPDGAGKYGAAGKGANRQGGGSGGQRGGGRREGDAKSGGSRDGSGGFGAKPKGFGAKSKTAKQVVDRTIAKKKKKQDQHLGAKKKKKKR